MMVCMRSLRPVLGLRAGKISPRCDGPEKAPPTSIAAGPPGPPWAVERRAAVQALPILSFSSPAVRDRTKPEQLPTLPPDQSI